MPCAISRPTSAGGLDGADGHARLMERMHNFADAMPAVRTFSLLDADGRVLASSAADLVGRDLSRREYFQTAKQIGQTDALLVGRPFFGMLGGWVLVLGRTVPGADGAWRPAGGGAGCGSISRPCCNPCAMRGHARQPGAMVTACASWSWGRQRARWREPGAGGHLFTRHRESRQAASVLQGLSPAWLPAPCDGLA